MCANFFLKIPKMRKPLFLIWFLFVQIHAQNYEVADIDCAIGTGGKELLTARLRRPEGFRGTPIFADDRGAKVEGLALQVPQELVEDLPCQIYQDGMDSSGRVFKLRITDFSQCGVMKRNGFIHVRIWFPQLPGVVMLSDQEVIIMCKPPAATVVQSKTAGFAGSIPSGARISGIVEESPGRLEYEVALYRETSTPSSLAARSSGAFITGADSHELPVDQAVPIGTRLQLRAKINQDSAWKYAKLMEVSVSPDPKDPLAEGSVALVRDGCRNQDLASIIPKQPYRYKERSNEVVLDFEAFLLSNMNDRSTLWLHTQIKACMESQDCHPEFCMDVYQPSGFGKRRKRSNGISSTTSSSIHMSKSNATSMDYSAPLSQHWTAYADEIIIDNPVVEEDERNVSRKVPSSTPLISLPLPPETTVVSRKFPSTTPTDSGSTNFGDNIGFSVIMPSDYYRSSDILSSSVECRGWVTTAAVSLMAAIIAGLAAFCMSFRTRRSKGKKSKLYGVPPQISVVRTNQCSKDNAFGVLGAGEHHKYARDPSIYRS